MRDEPLTPAGTLDRSAELQQVAIFAGLDVSARLHLAAEAMRGTYRRGEIILAQGDERDGIFAIASGQVRLSRSGLVGREVTVATLGAGDIFGLSFLASVTPSRNALVATETPTVVYELSRAAFVQIISADPSVALASVELLGRELAALADRVEDLALHGTGARLARALLLMATPKGRRLVVRQTHGEIAAWIGVRSEEVTKQVGALRAAGIVHTEPRRTGITILDVDRLSARAEEKIAGM